MNKSLKSSSKRLSNRQTPKLSENFISAALAHEVRNPLTALATLVQLLPSKQGNPAFMASFHQIASKEIDHLIHLTENYLDFCDMDSREKGIVDLEKVARQATELLTPLFREKKVQLKIRLFFGKPIIVKGDAHQIKSLIVNLLKNALEAVEIRGRVEMFLSTGEKRLGSWVRLSVRDNGRGIPRDMMGKIFEPYFTTQGKGRGLGLAICQKIVQNHGGHLKVLSSAKNGTLFSVLLPVVGPLLKPRGKAGISKKHPQK